MTQQTRDFASRSQFASGIAELDRRSMEGLRLYRPRPEVLPFHLSRATERLVRGGVRAGKTLPCTAELASGALGIPLTDWSGKEIPFRYPMKRPLTIWVIGYDQRHLARVYKKLFRPGLFRIIQDRQTGKWRAWKPWEGDDRQREAETKPAPPMIPRRMIQDNGLVFENKAQRVLTLCRLKNGTEIEFFPSGGEPGQGEAVDLIWIDEDIQYSDHVDEWQSRLTDVRGRLIWSAWPHTKNDAIELMSKRAKDEADSPNPDVFELLLAMSANPYLPKEEVEKRRKAWAAKGSQVLRSRDYGEFATDSVLVFPDFDADVHGLPSEGEPDALERLLASMKWKPPKTWTWYLALDPGHQHCVVELIAVPPPDVGDYVIVADEIYLQQIIDAHEVARAVSNAAGEVEFEAFIIDHRAGRQTSMAGGPTIEEQFSEAFRKAGLKSRRTGHDFLAGSDNVTARNMVTRSWMRARPEGPKLRCIAANTPELIRESRLYKKRVTRDDTKEEVSDRDNHAWDALGYYASLSGELGYVEPPMSERSRRIVNAFKELKEQFEPASEAGPIVMGLGAAPNSLFGSN